MPCRPRVPAPCRVIMATKPDNTERDIATSTTTPLTLLEMQSNADSNEYGEARLQNLPKELIDMIGTYLKEEALAALSATSRQLASKLLDQRFRHLTLHLGLSAGKLKDVENIVAHKDFGRAVRSVTIDRSIGSKSDHLIDELFSTIQRAPNIASLAVDGKGDDIDSALPEETTLPGLKKLSLINGKIELETLLDFVESQPQLEELHIERLRVGDYELGDHCVIPLPGFPYAVIKGFGLANVLREQTAIKKVFVDEQSEKIWGD